MRTLTTTVDRGRCRWSGVGSRHGWAFAGALAAAHVAAPGHLAGQSARAQDVIVRIVGSNAVAWDSLSYLPWGRRRAVRRATYRGVERSAGSLGGRAEAA